MRESKKWWGHTVNEKRHFNEAPLLRPVHTCTVIAATNEEDDNYNAGLDYSLLKGKRYSISSLFISYNEFHVFFLVS